MADAGTVIVRELEPLNVVGTIVPLNATVELVVKPVPERVNVVVVLYGPAVTDIEVNVGGGGLTIFTSIPFDTDGVARGLVTVIVADPRLARRLAGTVACGQMPDVVPLKQT
jgi:hypothetical protein